MLSKRFPLCLILAYNTFLFLNTEIKVGRRHRSEYFMMFYFLLTTYRMQMGSKAYFGRFPESLSFHWGKKGSYAYLRWSDFGQMYQTQFENFFLPFLFFGEFLLCELLILNKWPYKRKGKFQESLKLIFHLVPHPPLPPPWIQSDQNFRSGLVGGKSFRISLCPGLYVSSHVIRIFTASFACLTNFQSMIWSSLCELHV